MASLGLNELKTPTFQKGISVFFNNINVSLSTAGEVPTLTLTFQEMVEIETKTPVHNIWVLSVFAPIPPFVLANSMHEFLSDPWGVLKLHALTLFFFLFLFLSLSWQVQFLQLPHNTSLW